ncbi:MAG: DUF421 domain-containing protein [Oscillospiraceae bacterium]|jgi:uncharacterized membrane protein YcaP (DUF421 family)|nr:DUF421 domain-containing protein [Oscillospiraceae bacterium]
MAIAIIRTFIIYFIMVVSMRVMGKRQLGELEPAELVVAVLISDIAAGPLNDLGTPLLYGLAPIFTLVFCEVMLSAIVLKSRLIRNVVSGSPSIIIENGRLLPREMKRNRYTIDEMMEHLRKNGVESLASVKYAILETDGTLSTMLYAAESPATPKQMNIVVPEAGMPVVVISDGSVVSEGLKKLGLNRYWLADRLSETGHGSANEVFLMTVDTSGTVYTITREVI